MDTIPNAVGDFLSKLTVTHDTSAPREITLETDTSSDEVRSEEFDAIRADALETLIPAIEGLMDKHLQPTPGVVVGGQQVVGSHKSAALMAALAGALGVLMKAHVAGAGPDDEARAGLAASLIGSTVSTLLPMCREGARIGHKRDGK